MSVQLLQDKLTRHLAFYEQDENNVHLLMEICKLYLELGEVEHAELHLQKAKILGEEKALFPMELFMARVLINQEKLQQAKTLLENILQKNAHYAEAIGLLSLIYWDMEESELADKLSKQALHYEVENYDARLVQVLINLKEERYSEKEIKNLLKIKPEDARLWFALGTSSLYKGKCTAAITALEKATEFAPQFYDAYIALAWCFLLDDNMAKARKAYKAATELDETAADGWGGLALIYALEKKITSMEPMLARAEASVNPDCFMVELALAFRWIYQHPNQISNLLNQKNLSIGQKLVLVLDRLENKTLH